MTNTLAIACPKCQREFEVRRHGSGDPVVCEQCQHSFHPKVTIPCPQCRRSLQVRREYLGKRIFCSYCKHTFRAALPGEEDIPLAGPPWALPGPLQAANDASRIKVLEVEVANLRADLTGRAAETARRQQEALALQVAADQLAHVAQELETLRQERDELATRTRTQRQELDQLRGRVTELEQTLAQAASGTQALEIDWPRELEASRARLEAERQAYQTEAAQARGRVTELETTLAQVRSSQAVDAQRVAAEIQTLRTEREQLQTRGHALTSELEMLRLQIDDLKQMPVLPAADPEEVQRAVAEARRQWEQDQEAFRREGEQANGQQGEAEKHVRAQLEQASSDRRLLELDRVTLEKDLARVQNEITTLRGELSKALRQADTLTQDRDRLSLECDQLRIEAAAAAEQRLDDRLPPSLKEVNMNEPAGMPAPNGSPLPQRFLDLAEELRSLRDQVEDRLSAAHGGGRGEKGSGWLGGLFGKTNGSKGESDPLRDRLETLRIEALAEREKHLLAEADATRADLEQQLAELKAQLQEAQERAEQLELQLSQGQSHGRPYRPGARYDPPHDAPYSGPSPGSGTAASGPWRLDELT